MPDLSAESWLFPGTQGRLGERWAPMAPSPHDCDLQGATTLPWALLGGLRSPNVLLQQSGVVRGELLLDHVEELAGASLA